MHLASCCLGVDPVDLTLMRSLEARGAVVTMDAGYVVIAVPRGVLTAADRAALQRHRPVVLLSYTAPRQAYPRCHRCQRVLPIGHAVCAGGCSQVPTRSVAGYPPAGSQAPDPAPVGVEYEPGADWSIDGEEQTPPAPTGGVAAPAACHTDGADTSRQAGR